jgi:glucokinase
MTDVAFGFDLGGTALKFGLVTPEGRIIASGSVAVYRKLGMSGIREALREGVARVEALSREHRVVPIVAGAGCAGSVVGPRGKLLTPSPNLPFMRGFEVAGFLQDETGLPAVAENDATVAALAEFRLGAGRGATSLLMATVGTGLGGGLVVNGALIRGWFGTAGEIGHGTFEPRGLKCGCGSRGCLEQYTASRAIKRFYREEGGTGPLRVRSIIDEARAGRRPARAAAARIGTNLGIGLATCAALVPVDVIAVGGGTSALGPLLLGPMRKAFAAHSLPGVRKTVRIVRATLGNQAGLAGAALLALDVLAPPRKRRSRAG